MTIRDTISDILLPAACSGCGRGHQIVCQACDETLKRAPFDASSLPPALSGAFPLWALHIYRGVARYLIIAAKHDVNRDFNRYLSVWGASLGSHLGQLLPPRSSTRPIAVVAAPSSFQRRLKKRLVAPVIADGIVRGLSAFYPCFSIDPLRLHDSGQAGRSPAQRMGSRRGTMTCRVDFGGYDVIVVDDVVTTGATLMESVDAVCRFSSTNVTIMGATCICVAPPFLGANNGVNV